MSEEDIADKLLRRLAELEGRLAKIERDVTSPHSSDWAEQAQERENDEVVDAIGNETAVAIRSVRAALQRLEDGSYGECRLCGEPIAQARLATLPETTTCIRCESVREQTDRPG